MQLKTFANQAGVSVSVIKSWLRRSRFASPERHYKSPDTELTRDEVNELEDAKASGALWREVAFAPMESGIHDILQPSPNSEDIEDLQSAQVGSVVGQARAQGAHAIYVHVDVLEWLQNHDGRHDQRRVFTRRVQELMAHGRATRMKGTKGASAGWLRTPLGGNSGAQYYLWLTNSGEVVRRQIDSAKALHAHAPAGRASCARFATTTTLQTLSMSAASTTTSSLRPTVSSRRATTVCSTRWWRARAPS